MPDQSTAVELCAQKDLTTAIDTHRLDAAYAKRDGNTPPAEPHTLFRHPSSVVSAHTLDISGIELFVFPRARLGDALFGEPAESDRSPEA